MATHGMYKTKLYQRWKGMRKRCNNVNEPCYKNYGGRGIKVCTEWHNFEVFYEWSLANGYSEDLQLDRIDNNKGYSPDNCRWSTRKENGLNKRNNVLITIDGETKVLSQWSEDTGLPITTILHRYNQGWVGQAIISKPMELRNREIAINGLTKTITEWAKQLGIPRKTLEYRINNGWSEDRLLKGADINGIKETDIK